VCPCFTKSKVRRKKKKRVVAMQKVWTLSPTLQKRGKEKGKTNFPK